METHADEFGSQVIVPGKTVDDPFMIRVIHLLEDRQNLPVGVPVMDDDGQMEVVCYLKLPTKHLNLQIRGRMPSEKIESDLTPGNNLGI